MVAMQHGIWMATLHFKGREEKVKGEKRLTIYFKGWSDIFPASKFPRRIPLVLALNVQYFGQGVKLWEMNKLTC
jgi:hypothetical protein